MTVTAKIVDNTSALLHLSTCRVAVMKQRYLYLYISCIQPQVSLFLRLTLGLEVFLGLAMEKGAQTMAVV